MTTKTGTSLGIVEAPHELASRLASLGVPGTSFVSIKTPNHLSWRCGEPDRDQGRH